MVRPFVVHPVLALRWAVTSMAFNTIRFVSCGMRQNRFMTVGRVYVTMHIREEMVRNVMAVLVSQYRIHRG
jgi:hypothetical protein